MLRSLNDLQGDSCRQEVWGIYTALATHSAVSIDFIEEDSLTEDGLVGYKLLVVTAPNLPAENLKMITRWVRGGGTRRECAPPPPRPPSLPLTA